MNEPQEPLVPRQWVQAVITDLLHCRRCGYNLRGLHADGRCPECGQDIWTSVVATVDPAASQLPSLRNPAAVGNALLVLTLCMMLGAVLLVVPSVAQLVETWDRSGVRDWSRAVPSLTWGYAAVLALVWLSGLWLLAPPRGSEPHGAVWIDLWRIGIGYLGWLLFASMWMALPALMPRIGEPQRLVLHLAAGVFATIGLIGLRGVFRIIGQRSREYRRLQGGRQSLDLIIVAIAAGVLGALVRWLSRFDWVPGQWAYGVQTLGMLVMWISHFMVLVGLSYLVVNAWMIQRSLRRPPPPLDQVLMPHLPPDTWIPDREE